MISDMLLYHFGYGAHGPARRGKRLRPNMTLRAAQECGASLERALDAAAAVELLHNYSLVHDDIEDRDELRHGRPTLWARYGVEQAINAGDAMCALSFLTLARAREHQSDATVLDMIVVLHRAHATMCDGQSMDIGFEAAAGVALDEYMVMIDAKTAALFEAALTLGARSAEVAADALEAYRELGRAYGRAFQVYDDVSGIWSSVDATGKMAAHDIARRKWTYPVAWALGSAPSAARDAIAAAYARREPLDAGSVARVVDALDALGARQAAMRAAAEAMAVVESWPHRALRDYLLETLAAPA